MSTPLHRRYSLFTTITLVAVATLGGCDSTSSTWSKHSTSNTNSTMMLEQARATPAIQAVVGDYVSDGYDKRAQGYDWVAVMVQAKGDNKIDIKVRARSDIKKPSCHFEAQATLLGQDKAHGIIFQSTVLQNAVFQSNSNSVDKSTAFFQFKNNTLIIDGQDKYTLQQFCSGGGSLAGEYQKLQSKLVLN